MLSNIELYTFAGVLPLSIEILQARWRAIGHILRLPESVPAFQAMKHFFFPPVELDGKRITEKRQFNPSKTTIHSIFKKDIELLSPERRLTLLGITELKHCQDIIKMRAVATWRRRNDTEKKRERSMGNSNKSTSNSS